MNDIDSERQRALAERNDPGDSRLSYPNSYLETLAVYRRIAEILPSYDIILFHGSAVAVDDEAYLFTAPSGVGKSTHTRLWRQLLGERAIMVNDDKPLIKCTTNGIFVCGTPWDGKHHLNTNVMVPLKAICALERGIHNDISPLRYNAIFPILLRQSYRPRNKEMYTRTLNCLNMMENSISFWKLACNMDLEAAKISYETMKGAGMT